MAKRSTIDPTPPPPPRRFRIEFTRAAAKELAALPAKVQSQIARTIDELETNPRPSGCTKLKGEGPDLWRVYSGVYRVIYAIEDARLIITVIRVGHRKDVYRGL